MSSKDDSGNRIEVGGSGAAAQGSGATAAGEGGVAVGGNVYGPVIVAGQVAESFWQQFKPQRLSVAELQQATQRYLTYLLDRYRYLDFKGMGVSDRVPLRLPLVEMYVPLKARIELPEGETWRRQELRLAGRKLSPEEAEAMGHRVSEPVAVLKLLQQQPGLVLLGDPGAGKTTFLKYLALRLAGGEGPALGLGQRLPILLPLSAYANALAGKDIALDQFIPTYYRDLGIDLPLGPMLGEALAQGGALLLLDGLDEVKDSGERRLVVDRVVDFFSLQKQRGNKFILTSRIVGYREVRPTTTDLAEGTLVDFEAEEIKTFISKWTGALERAARGDTPIAAQEAALEEAELLAALERNPGVRRLAANPLLLTILALMKRQGITLPERRVELYQKYVDTLLKGWNLARGLGRPAQRDLDVVETLKVLAPLALWMHQTSPGVGLVKREAMRRELERIYAERQVARPDQAARQLLADVREHASLLLERGAGEYGFIHLTFQEYLAALALAQRGQREVKPVVEALSQYIADSEWREVVLLTVGYMGIIQQRDEAAGELVWELIRRSPGRPGQAVVLAGDAVLDAGAGGVTPQTRTKVVDVLFRRMRADRRVEPGTRVAAGDTLARLGDPRPGVGLRADGLPDMAWCEVAAGPFMMGSDKSKDKQADDDELPQHTVSLPAFKIARYPVTNAQYAAFVGDGGYREKWRQCWTAAGWQWKGERAGPESYGGGAGLPNHPVVGLRWYEAIAFCRWLTTRLRQAGELGPDQILSLPSEAEWEKAARGTDGRVYPWGNEPDPNRASYDETGLGVTSAVGCFPGGSSPYGVEEMSGNVWEWSRTKWQANYERDQVDDDDLEGDAGRVVRGGAFHEDRWDVRCASRGGSSIENGLIYLGFRVVVVSPNR